MLIPTAPHPMTVTHHSPSAHEASLDHALVFARRMLDAVHQFALQFDLPALGAINLPPVVGSAADQAHLQTAGPLYLASELEAALLLPAVETLAGIFMSGGLPLEAGAAGRDLETFWQTRHERFSAKERQAFFARLFGGDAGPQMATQDGRNTQFDSLMIDLSEAIYKLEPAPGFGPQPDTMVTLQTAASALAANLVSRSGGFAAYAGTELLGGIETALKILKVPAVQQAVQARSVWGAVRNISQMYLQQEVDVDSHVTRGKAGLLVLNWLTQALPSLGGSSGAFMLPDASVLSAAPEWLQSSLTLAEQATPTGTRA